jgi:hypothetical protein
MVCLQGLKIIKNQNSIVYFGGGNLSEFSNACNVEGSMSSAYHPQTDGQIEVVDKYIEDYLRHFGCENQDDWDTLLVFAEFAYNNSLHESTNSTPFRLNYGYNPRLPTSFSIIKQSQENPPKHGKISGVDQFFDNV